MTIEKAAEFGEIKDVGVAGEFFTLLTASNDKMYNKTKLLEELAELNEKILKSINKHSTRKPSEDDIIDEIGDVLIRISMYSKSEGISEDRIEKRIISKANKFIDYINTGIYSNL